MLVKDIPFNDFESFINKHELIFVDFWTKWCAPCKEFARLFKKVADENKEITFVSINLEEHEQYKGLFDIQSVPHLMVFKQGIAIYSDSGSLPLSSLKELVEQALATDVSDLLAKG